METRFNVFIVIGAVPLQLKLSGFFTAIKKLLINLGLLFMRFTTLVQWLNWQTSIHYSEIDLGLARVNAVAQRLNLLPLPFPVINVAGTNGKGSSVVLLDTILVAASYRVGRYTSPHLLRYNERICVNGIEATDSQLCQSFHQIEEARGDISLTFFEFGTLAALLVFQQSEIDLAILEVGLGGRLDAVNIVDPEIALITAIDVDHTDYLGHDRESIGFEKAGILRAQRPAVCSDPNPPQSLLKHAQQLSTSLSCLGRDFTYQKNHNRWNWQHFSLQYQNLPIPNLPGDFQLQNAAGVLMVLQLLKKFPVTKTAIQQGLTGINFPGRFQVLSGDVTTILDVTHNPLSAQTLAELLHQCPCQGETHALVGMLKDKDIGGVLSTMLSEIKHWHVASLNVPRGASAEYLADNLLTIGAKHIYTYSSIAKAYQYLLNHVHVNDRIIVFGSFYTVAEVLAMVTK